jgi:hypothetical protein
MSILTEKFRALMVARPVKVIEEYLENALAFEQLAAVEIDPTLKDDFEKQAGAFRKLAAERAKRLSLGPPENSN